MPQPTIKHLASGGVITNYHCVSRCGHCLYNSGPHRRKAYLASGKAKPIFRRILDLGCRSVHIGGGEPMLEPELLADVLDVARTVGMGIDYVETNSAWFVDPGQADAVLNRLRPVGLATLLVSISPFHNASIPYARVTGVIDACRRTGIQVFPWVNAFVRDLSRLDQRRPHAMNEFEAAYGGDYLRRIPDRYWVHLGGRALDTFRPVYKSHPAAHILKHSPLSCARALADTSHFHIDLHGNYIPGLCTGLAIHMEDLGRPLPAGKYPLLDRLAATGINGLHDLASQAYGFTPQRDGFLNHCDLCTDIRAYLSRLEGSHFPELAPEGFYAAQPDAP